MPSFVYIVSSIVVLGISFWYGYNAVKAILFEYKAPQIGLERVEDIVAMHLTRTPPEGYGHAVGHCGICADLFIVLAVVVIGSGRYVISARNNVSFNGDDVLRTNTCFRNIS